ncbi:protein FAR-RED IMPAIRED RESPONSE 1-like [Rhododendron vialii]|uniref:protein FAR-RED IMPAIRED RESPONSE 1-like n=1 Tax=Rhododendron vialii TaxID=182163 RepID=UPI0026605A34|nr:protein FAR-RED IMPAIRED RESPONSE 1-like [Rhododendron vialii]
MTFDISEEAYSYYSRYGKEKGFDVAKRTLRKGKDGKLKDVTIACSHAGKWRLNQVDFDHNHDQSPGKTYAPLQIEARGPGNAQTMHNYFMKMKADNFDFFFAMDLDDEGMNHHVHSVLLGCRLISHEDTKSFSWLFQIWKTCMWGCAPKAIITDQCMAIKNAIQGYSLTLDIGGAYVYASFTIKQFEDAWDLFIKKYELQSNTWLEGLYLERKWWVPAYLNDMFWAGMSSTQRSENINMYFDGYVHSKMTLKQFVGQYENALGNKVESENQAKVGDIVSNHEINEWVTYGEGEQKKRIQVSFTVDFNVETNETHCNCRLFKSRGMCKNVKRVHTKVWIYYDKSSTSIEACRHDNICNLLNEVVDLAEESEVKYDIVMKQELENFGGERSIPLLINVGRVPHSPLVVISELKFCCKNTQRQL